MPNRRRALLVSAVCSISLVAVSAAQAETLVAALTEAYQTNPTLQQARIAQRIADETYYQNLINQTGPGTLNLTLSQGVNFESLDNVTPAGFSGISLTQRLTTGGTLNRNLTRGEIALFRARDALRQAEQTTMRTVITDYINVLTNEKAVEIQEAALRTSQRNLDNFQAQYDVGTVIRTDVEQNRVQLLNAQNALQSAQNALANAKVTYAIDVGHNPDDEIEAPPPLPNLPASYEEAIALAMQWGPTWRTAVYTDRLAELNLADAKIRPLPVVSAQVGYALGSGEIRTNAIRDIPNKDALTAGLTVSVPLYSFGLNSSAVRVAQETRNSTRIALENSKDQLTSNIQNLWNNMINARNAVEINKASLDAQTLATQGKRAQYQLGGLSTTDLLTAEDQLRSAQRNAINQMTALYTTEANLLQQIGLLDPRYLVPTVTPFDPLENFQQLKTKFVIVPYAPALTAVDSLFAPKLADPVPGAELPVAKVKTETPLPTLGTMARAPSEEIKEQYVIKAVPDAPPPLPPQIPFPVPPPIDTTGLQQNGPPGAAGGRGGAPAGGFGGGGGGRGG